MITLITGVPGTGKTAMVVSMLEAEVAAGRIIFTNITGLKIPHYTLGNMADWQKGSWLHIDRYQRNSAAVAMESCGDDGGDTNWLPLDDVVKDVDGALRRIVLDKQGQPVGSVEYENHKGALIVYDECQNTYRPRPAGSAVPDYVSALEVHRKQGLDFWMVTQRPLQVDSNLRGLCGKHIALRNMALGRYRYEWPEVGDIESKTSRDNAARTRFKLPKHVFNLYQSAEVHTKNSHKLPMMAKVALLAIPAFAFFAWQSYSIIAGKFNPAPIKDVMAASMPVLPVSLPSRSVSAVSPGVSSQENLPAGFEPYSLKEISAHHPFERSSFRITGRLTSATKDMFSFAVSGVAGVPLYMSSVSLTAAGYIVVPVNDCSVKLIYKAVEFFVTCVDQSLPVMPYQVAALSG